MLYLNWEMFSEMIKWIILCFVYSTAGIDTPPYRPPHDPDREPRQQSQVWKSRSMIRTLITPKFPGVGKKRDSSNRNCVQLRVFLILVQWLSINCVWMCCVCKTLFFGGCVREMIRVGLVPSELWYQGYKPKCNYVGDL